MKKIAVITATRAEYGLMCPVIKKLRTYENDELKIDLVVTGTHLDVKYGYTISEIESDGLRIDYKVRIPIESESGLDISENQAFTLVEFTKLFIQKKYSAIVILGDRYEMLAISIAACNTKIPIIHLCGGDTTEGAQDEWIRHSITKMANLHFVTNEESKKRVIQLGENPTRVYNYGSTSIDNILFSATMSKDEALESVGLKSCVYAIGTYHPVTLANSNIDAQMENFFEAIQKHCEIEFIITKSNADQGGMKINNMLDEASDRISNLHVFTSLGVKRYLSLMKNAEFVIGNSSSGIIETPAFKIPTINIGDRQKGRLSSDSVINCDATMASIDDAIKLAMSVNFKQICSKVVSPYGDGTAAEKIAKEIVKKVMSSDLCLIKSFYNIMETI